MKGILPGRPIDQWLVQGKKITEKGNNLVFYAKVLDKSRDWSANHLILKEMFRVDMETNVL